jgi:hypothetical protein
MNSNEQFEDASAKEEESGRLGFALEAVSLAAMKSVLSASYPHLSDKQLTKAINSSDFFFKLADKLVEIKR